MTIPFSQSPTKNTSSLFGDASTTESIPKFSFGSSGDSHRPIFSFPHIKFMCNTTIGEIDQPIIFEMKFVEKSITIKGEIADITEDMDRQAAIYWNYANDPLKSCLWKINDRIVIRKLLDHCVFNISSDTNVSSICISMKQIDCQCDLLRLAGAVMSHYRLRKTPNNLFVDISDI